MEDATSSLEVSVFSWVDYLVFSSLLLVSASIGLYHGIKDKKNTNQFLMAGKSMSSFPVAMSLIASFISAIGLMGIPSEVYSYGTMFIWSGLSFLLVFPAATFIYVPVFWNLQITSVYEYLEMRFHVIIRVICSLMFMCQTLLYMAIVVYAPALALTQVTGLSHILSVSLICLVCVFYTAVGGIKAVLWTDVLQIGIIALSSCVVYIKGTIDTGGISRVYNISSQYNRTDFSTIDLDPTIRNTVWSLLFGGYIHWVAIYGCSQTQIQRYLCLREKKMIFNTLAITAAGMIVIIIICGYGGLLTFTYYHECDPLAQGRILKSDQILPLFVMDVFRDWKGLPGLFVAGIFSGSLSTLSSGINSLAAITLEDLIKRPFLPNLPEKPSMILSVVLSLLYGLLTFGLVFVVGSLGSNVVTLAVKVFGLMGGPVLGCFTLGIFFPFVNTLGASIGSLTGLGLTGWIVVGTHLETMNKRIVIEKLPFMEGGCPNSTLIDQDPITKTADDVLYIYKISYMLYGIVGFVTTMVIGVVVSLLSGGRDTSTLNERTLVPGILKLYKKLLPKRSGDAKDKPIELTRHTTKGMDNLGFKHS